MLKFWLMILLAAWPAQALEIVEETPVENATVTIAETTELPNASPIEILATADIATIERLLASGLNAHERDADGYTPLYYVLTENPNLAVAQRLIIAGADVNAPMADGVTPLILATSRAKQLRLEQQKLESLQISQISAIPQQQIQTYIKAQKKHSLDMLKMLIEYGADVNQETPFGTPLMNAATDEWNLPLVETLLQAGAAVNAQDQSGQTALFYARLFKCDDIEAILLKAGADTDIRDRYGRIYMDIEPNLAAQQQVLIPEK